MLCWGLTSKIIIRAGLNEKGLRKLQQSNLESTHLLLFCLRSYDPTYNLTSTTKAVVEAHGYIFILGMVTADTRKGYFCPGTGIWIRKRPDNLF